MSIEQEEILSDDGLFGTVICKECHTIWVKEFVPEFCTKCGVRVAAVRGEGEERMISLVGVHNLIDIFREEKAALASF